MLNMFKFPPNFIEKNYEFMLLNSKLLKEVDNILNLWYDVNDLLSNDIDALKARNSFVNISYNDYIF